MLITDKRKKERHDLGLLALVTWPTPVQCTIVDVSTTGARLTTERVDLLPDEFDLALKETLLRRCQVVWRRDNQVGIKFVSIVDPDNSCAAYTVAPAKDAWMIECNTGQRGPFLSNDVALRVAIAEAMNLRREGKLARVSVQRNDGSLCVEYCLCSRFRKSQTTLF